jgi:hypothetical protein
MVCFQAKNTNLGNFWRYLDWKMFIYFIATWNILWRFRVFYGDLGYFMTIWYILYLFGTFFVFGIMYQEKSGNPGRRSKNFFFFYFWNERKKRNSFFFVSISAFVVGRFPPSAKFEEKLIKPTNLELTRFQFLEKLWKKLKINSSNLLFCLILIKK